MSWASFDAIFLSLSCPLIGSCLFSVWDRIFFIFLLFLLNVSEKKCLHLKSLRRVSFFKNKIVLLLTLLLFYRKKSNCTKDKRWAIFFILSFSAKLSLIFHFQILTMSLKPHCLQIMVRSLPNLSEIKHFSPLKTWNSSFLHLSKNHMCLPQSSLQSSTLNFNLKAKIPLEPLLVENFSLHLFLMFFFFH